MMFARILVAALVAVLTVPLAPAVGQETPAAAAPPAAGVATTATPPAEVPISNTFSVEQLDQIVSPIALYPDPLLMQILMASTYRSR